MEQCVGAIVARNRAVVRDRHCPHQVEVVVTLRSRNRTVPDSRDHGHSFRCSQMPHSAASISSARLMGGWLRDHACSGEFFTSVWPCGCQSFEEERMTFSAAISKPSAYISFVLHNTSRVGRT